MTLRIEKSESGKAETLVLSGQLNALGLVELQKLCEDHKEGEQLILDLAEVRLVDRSAVKFLAFCECGGIQLENCPAYIRDWVSREQQRSD